MNAIEKISLLIDDDIKDKDLDQTRNAIWIALIFAIMIIGGVIFLAVELW
jgi:hypothetical protein